MRCLRAGSESLAHNYSVFVAKGCDASGDELDGSHEEPGGGAFDGIFEVFGEATGST